MGKYVPTFVTDMFGVTYETPRYKGKGYMYQPGTGPAGETCGSCAAFLRMVFPSGKTVFKCSHTQTVSEKTDIRKGAPACRAWEEP